MTITPGARERSARGEGDRLRDEILAAAEALLLEHGDAEAVSVRMIARAVGVAPASIYLHFPDKQELVFAVCERHFAVLVEHMREATAGLDDPLERLAAIGRAYVRFGLDHPQPYRVIFMTSAQLSPERFTDGRLAGMIAFHLLVDAVQDCIDAGQMRGELDAFATAVVMWSSVHGITSLLITKPAFPWPDREAVVEEVLTASIAAFVAS